MGAGTCLLNSRLSRWWNNSWCPTYRLKRIDRWAGGRVGITATLRKVSSGRTGVQIPSLVRAFTDKESMGRFNSSKTRVVPVFDALYQRDSSGSSWLPALAALGSRAAGLELPSDFGRLPEDYQPYWGEKERRLDPPPALLQWLAGNASKPASDKLWGSEQVRALREQLVAGDEAVIKQALESLQNSPRRRAWYVLEGESFPDAFLQTDKLLFVIEGKRKESKLTTTTTWMAGRSQIIRHMDAAWEVRGGRRVLGLTIVEGEGGSEAVAPSPYWMRQSDDQVAPKKLADSLPHRDAGSRTQLASGFLGVTTWQRVCKTFRILWPPFVDVVPARGTLQ